MRVLILGGTGLISQEIVRQLADRGDEVTVFNRGQTATGLPAGVARITGNRGSVALLRPWLENAGIDCLIDMIGYTRQEAAALAGLTAGAVSHVIYCSTVDVFSKPQPRYPVREDALRAARPSFPYAAGKAESEMLLERAAGDGAFALTILRPAQTYGGPNHGPVHPLGHRDYHLARLAAGQPILLHGDGTSLWSACQAADVAAAFTAAAHERGARGRSYNLASPELVTWERYWQVVGEAFAGREPLIVTLPTDLLAERFGDDGTWLLENFRFNNVFDCSAAQAELAFAPRTSLREGMAQLAARYGQAWAAEGATEIRSAFGRCYDETLRWRERLRD